MATPKTYVQAVPPSQTKTEESAPPTPGTKPPAAHATAPVAPPAVKPAEPAREYRQAAEGAQYVPAPKPPTLLEILPAEYQTTNPPLIYRLSTVSDPATTTGRIATSRTYRAKAFSTHVFYKPISRTLVEWEEQ